MKTLKFFSTMLILLVMCLPMVACQGEDEPVSDDLIEGYWANDYEVWFFEDGFCSVSGGEWTASGTYGNGKITITDSEDDTDVLKYSMPDNSILVIHEIDGELWGRYTRYE